MDPPNLYVKLPSYGTRSSDLFTKKANERLYFLLRCLFAIMMCICAVCSVRYIYNDVAVSEAPKSAEHMPAINTNSTAALFEYHKSFSIAKRKIRKTLIQQGLDYLSHNLPDVTAKFVQSAGSSSLSEPTPTSLSSIRNAEADGVNAVSTVDTFFQHKYARQVHPWVAGADQHIPALRPLGETTEDKWTSSPDVYGHHSLLVRDICTPLCQRCREAPAGWGCFPCASACGLHEIVHGVPVAFRVVPKAEEASRMAQPEPPSPPSLRVPAFQVPPDYPVSRPAGFKFLTAPLEHAAVMVASAQAGIAMIMPAHPPAPQAEPSDRSESGGGFSPPVAPAPPPPPPMVADAPPPQLPPAAAVAVIPADAAVDPDDAAPSDAAAAAAMASTALRSAVLSLAYPATRGATPPAAAEPAPDPAVSVALAPPVSAAQQSYLSLAPLPALLPLAPPAGPTGSGVARTGSPAFAQGGPAIAVAAAAPALVPAGRARARFVVAPAMRFVRAVRPARVVRVLIPQRVVIPADPSLPALPGLRYFRPARPARAGEFRNFDGHPMRVLRVVPEANNVTISLDPDGGTGGGGKDGAAAGGGLVARDQAISGLLAAAAARSYFAAADRSDVRYTEYGEVAAAAGEAAGDAPRRGPGGGNIGGPVLLPSDPFGLLPAGQPPARPREPDA